MTVTKVTYGLGGLSVREAVDMVLGAQMGSEWAGTNLMSYAKPKPEIPTRGRARGWEFLPPVPRENYVFGYTMFQAALMARESINLHYATAALIDMGEPSALAAENWRDESALRPFREYVEAAILLPTCKGVLPDAGGDRDRMLSRVAQGDLSTGYPYQAGHRFAARILTDQWIARQYLPVLRQAAGSAHPFLRRNAVYVLASLAYARDPEARRILHEVVERKNDAVAWFRAARILTDSRDPKIAEVLGKALPGRDPVTAAFAMRQLGAMRHAASAAALLRTSHAFDSDLDVQWAFLEAVGRLPGVEAPLHRRAQELAERYEDGKGKAKILRDLALVAVDRATTGRQVTDLAAGSCDRGPAREGKAALLGEFSPSIRGLLVEHLGRVGWPRLKEVIQDRKESMPVRSLAIAAGLWKGADVDWLAALARDRKEPFELRAAAALKLFELDPARGGPACGVLVDAYAEGYTEAVTQDLERAVHNLLEAAGPGLVPGLLARAHRAGLEVRVHNKMKKQGEFVETLTGLLVARGEAPALPSMRSMLSSAESVYRMNAAFALSHFTSPAGLRRTFELLSHDDPFVRQAAAFGLEKNAKLSVDCDWVFGLPHAREVAVQQARVQLGLE